MQQESNMTASWGHEGTRRPVFLGVAVAVTVQVFQRYLVQQLRVGFLCESQPSRSEQRAAKGYHTADLTIEMVSAFSSNRSSLSAPGQQRSKSVNIS